MHYFQWQWQQVETRVNGRSWQPAALRAWWTIGLLTVVFGGWLYYRLIVQPAWPAQLPQNLYDILALAETAVAFTLSFLWLTLIWRRLRPHKKPANIAPQPAHTVADLYALDPYDFEAYVAELFRRKGYKVMLKGRSGDQGVDLEVLQRNGRKAIVQCKRYRHTVGADTVRELFGTLIHERAAHAFLVTTADISDAARAWAEGKPLTLIDGDTLVAISASLN